MKMSTGAIMGVWLVETLSQNACVFAAAGVGPHENHGRWAAIGIDADEARRLVVHGFFADIIKKIGVPALEERLMATVEAELEKNVGANPTSAVPA